LRQSSNFDLLASIESRIHRGVDIHAQKVELRTGTTYSSLKNPSDSLLAALGWPVKSGAIVTADTAMNVSSVYACVQIISAIIARLPLNLLRRTSEGCEEILDHPACRLLQRTPDGVRTAFAWRQMLEATALLRGNAPARIIRNAYFEPESIGWMNPLQFEIWQTPDGEPYYRYRGQVLQPFDVLNHKELSLDGIRGMSPVTAMREQIGLAITTQEHGARHFSNGASPGVVLTAPISATPEQMNRIRDELQKNHGGVGNSGKPFVAYGGLTVSSVSLSNQDSQFLESRKFDIEEIARAFRVPLHLLQSTEKTTSWGTGVEQLNRAFVDYSLQDRLVRWQEELNLSFLSAADLDNGLYWKFDVSELVSGSNSDRAQYYQVMRNIGVMSINDVREAEGMNDIIYQDDDGEEIGDNYEQPFNGTGGTVQKEANEDPASEQKEAQAEAKEPPSAENESEQAEITKPKRKSKKKSATT